MIQVQVLKSPYLKKLVWIAQGLTGKFANSLWSLNWRLGCAIKLYYDIQFMLYTTFQIYKA